MNVHRLYKPLIQSALADWAEDRLYLSLDTSLFWEEYCLVRLAVVHRGRAFLHTFQEYGLRFDLEEAFPDDPSNGWNLQTSEIRSVCTLSRLWFLLAVATLYVTAQGVEVVATGKRRWVDPHWFRGNRYFRIGWDWLKTALDQDWPLIRHVRFTYNRDLEPAIASRKQHEQRTYRIEFKIHTYDYAAD